MTINCSWRSFTLPNIPIYEAKLPEDIIEKLWEFVGNAKSNANKDLAGNISSSLFLDDIDNYFLEFLSPVLKKYIDAYHGFRWNHKKRPGKYKLTLESFWVNYQKQTEVNPLHNHAGAISFVIWMKIPTEWKDQHNLPFAKHSNNACASDFEFVYVDACGTFRTYRYKMSSESEGTMVMFPATLWHQVYPFYECDEERVSISGNIVWEGDK